MAVVVLCSCKEEEPGSGPNDNSILGYQLLSDLNGHWVGTNQTSFGFYEWFAFDFRPISASHTHSIYEGGTNQNIITSVFLADYDGRQQIMARNGGWLGNQYRATYFLLDTEEINGNEHYYRLVDAVGGIDRAYIEFSFRDDSIFMDAYKDNSGSLDQPVHHMGFAGADRNPSYAERAIELFDFPQAISEVDFGGTFTNLIDPDSALFLEEDLDPFPKADHGHLSDLIIDITRNAQTEDKNLLLFISKEELVSSSGQVNLGNVDNAVVRTIDIRSEENSYTTTYLHPDSYFVTVFSDVDANGFPSAGDYSSVSIQKTVREERLENTALVVDLLIP